MLQTVFLVVLFRRVLAARGKREGCGEEQERGCGDRNRTGRAARGYSSSAWALVCSCALSGLAGNFCCRRPQRCGWEKPRQCSRDSRVCPAVPTTPQTPQHGVSTGAARPPEGHGDPCSAWAARPKLEEPSSSSALVGAWSNPWGLRGGTPFTLSKRGLRAGLFCADLSSEPTLVWLRSISKLRSTRPSSPWNKLSHFHPVASTRAARGSRRCSQPALCTETTFS